MPHLAKLEMPVFLTGMCSNGKPCFITHAYNHAHRWRSLEAGLAAMGSQAEAILDCVEEEEDSERAKPIDIEYLLSDVVPSILTLSG